MRLVGCDAVLDRRRDAVEFALLLLLALALPVQLLLSLLKAIVAFGHGASRMNGASLAARGRRWRRAIQSLFDDPAEQGGLDLLG
jgi:hypothetical protein